MTIDLISVFGVNCELNIDLIFVLRVNLKMTLDSTVESYVISVVIVDLI